jgi:hypothetical protein
MMEYGEKVTADPSTFDDPQYMFLRERLRALQDGWAEVHQMWENRQSLLSQSLSLQMFNRYQNTSTHLLISLFHFLCEAVLRIRIRRIHMFLGLPDPDPLVRVMDPDPDPAPDPDPSIIKQK